jgi:subtilisin family serine protease/subtilisin-like proprotein convertase family protein
VQAWGVTSSASNIIVSMIDTGVDYDHLDLYQNIWINQAEIPKSRLKNLVDVYHDGYISFRDLNNPINQGVGKITDVNGDGRIDAADILAPMILDAHGNDTGKGGWAYAGNTQDGDTAHPNDFVGWNFVSNNNQPFDDNGHGTNVAGILGATGNNGVGVAGVDWEVQLQAVKAFDSQGFSTIGDLVAAIGYSVKHGAEISNNSWAYRAPSTDLLNAVAGARAAGQIFVVAAGNFDNPEPDYPGNYSTQLDNIVAVASVDRSGRLASNSNYGATSVALAAPGVDIVSTAPGGGYSSYTGTSQATPFVTGVLALVWEQHPSWTYKQVINQVLSTTTPLASLKGKTITGGIVNAAAAVGALPNGGGTHVPGPTPHVLNAAFSGPDAHSFTRILLTFDQAIDPKTLTSANISLINASNQSVALTFAPSSDGRSLEIDFALQAAPGKYTLNLGAGVHDQAGDALAPYSTASSLSGPPYTFTSAGPTPIPNQGTLLSTITVNENFTIASLNVVLNIAFPVDNYLLLHLQAPDGTDILLVNQRGGSGSNFQNTVLSDQATASIRFAAAPFAASFQPETPLSTFAGKNARGVWKLWVVDERTGKAGVLTNWSLVFTPRAASSATIAGVSGESATTSANGIGGWLAGEPSGAQTVAPATHTQSNQERAAAVDAVFLSEEAKRDLRTSLLPAGWAFLVEHSADQVS